MTSSVVVRAPIARVVSSGVVLRAAVSRVVASSIVVRVAVSRVVAALEAVVVAASGVVGGAAVSVAVGVACGGVTELRGGQLAYKNPACPGSSSSQRTIDKTLRLEAGSD